MSDSELRRWVEEHRSHDVPLPARLLAGAKFLKGAARSLVSQAQTQDQRQNVVVLWLAGDDCEQAARALDAAGQAEDSPR